MFLLIFNKTNFDLIDSQSLNCAWEILFKKFFCVLIKCYFIFVQVITGCYARWINNFGNTSMIRGGEFLPIHTMLAELGAERAMFVCYCSLSSSLEQELRVRILWSIAVNGTNIFPSQV